MVVCHDVMNHSGATHRKSGCGDNENRPALPELFLAGPGTSLVAGRLEDRKDVVSALRNPMLKVGGEKCNYFHTV